MAAPTRRHVLAGMVGLAAAGALGGCGSSSHPSGVASVVPPRSLPEPSQAPFDTVVVLMMENRSFDHLLGWLPGADGKQAGLQYPDLTGKLHVTWDLGTDYQSCSFMGPAHQWQDGVVQLDHGKGDGFLFTQVETGKQTPTDLWPIGYFTKDAVPILGSLAQQYTTFDKYFAALNAGTWPNRLYQHAAATDVDITGIFLPNGFAVPGSKIQTTIWDRLAGAELTGGYYSYGEPMTAVFDSKKYDTISHPVDDFFTAATNGTLPNVSFIEPDYTEASEQAGTSNDDHPWGSIRSGEGFIQKVYDAVTHSPQWEKTVLVINFDEWGGFYDHIVPPTVKDDNVNPNPGPHPDYHQLGFRVPCIVVSPWSPATIVTEGPYEHCSILRMIEWRWGLDPMSLRDKTAKNLAATMDFSLKRAPAKLPRFTAPAPVACPPGSRR